jgi:hypothetical protein
MRENLSQHDQDDEDQIMTGVVGSVASSFSWNLGMRVHIIDFRYCTREHI